MASKGVGAGFKIDSSVNVLTDVSSYIRSIDPSTNVSRINIATLQPDVAAPIAPEIAGTRTRGYSLRCLFSKAAFQFFSAIEGMDGLDFEHGPDGFTAGDLKISGVCNCLNVPFPGAAADGDTVQEFTVEISVTSASVTTY